MLTDRARQLRRDSTEAEKTLWRHLRARQLNGAKFRRQHRIGPYIVDFVCLELHLIIELDGGQHAFDTPARTNFLVSEGYRILRFWNNEVLANPEGVHHTISQASRDE
jgi:very-short-patch-repair endonuclease